MSLVGPAGKLSVEGQKKLGGSRAQRVHVPSGLGRQLWAGSDCSCQVSPLGQGRRYPVELL